MDFPEELKTATDYVIKYVGDSTRDWFTIKKQIMLVLPPTSRQLFNRRHESTRKQIPNEYDYMVIDYWKEKTDVELVIDESKVHPKDWEWKPMGWALKSINKQRIDEAAAERNMTKEKYLRSKFTSKGEVRRTWYRRERKRYGRQKTS